MSATIDAPVAGPAPQRLARIAGVLFLLTFVTAIPPVVWFYAPVLSDPGTYVTGSGADMMPGWGALCELGLIAANIGTALALYPLLRRQNEALALGYVAARLVECGFIAVGIVAVLAITSLRGGNDSYDTLVVAARALAAVHDWTFRLGPGVVVGIGNGLILGWLMWTSRLVPRALSILGLIGGPLIVLSGAGVVLGLIPAGGSVQGIATIPEALWELGLGLWLTVRGGRGEGGRISKSPGAIPGPL